MKKINISLLPYFLSIASAVIANSHIVRAEETSADNANMEVGPITGAIGLIVLIWVTYKVYHLMYDGTILIGTNEGISKEKNRRLTIPLICGLICAAVVIKVLQFLGGIFLILFIIAIIIGVIVFVYKLISKRHNKSIKEVNQTNISIKTVSDTDTISKNDENNDTSTYNNSRKNSKIEEDVTLPTENKFDMNPIQNTYNDIDSQEDVSIIHNINFSSIYCESGNPIDISNSKKLYKALQNFHIPAHEPVYSIFDTTVLGSCKEGFAICESGVYIRVKDIKYYNWNDFKNVTLSYDNSTIIINGQRLNMGGKKEVEYFYELLSKLQKI